jgi:hypothetical protein
MVLSEAGEFSASSRSEDHGRQAILSRSSENEKQRFTRSGNLYGELDALRMAGP